MKLIYFDNAATTQVDSVVFKELELSAHSFFENVNSLHQQGQTNKQAILEKLQIMGRFFGVKTNEIIITSGATESNNLAILGSAEMSPKTKIITTKLEHPSITAPISKLLKSGYEVEFVNLKEDGTVDINHLQSLLDDSVFLVTIVGVDSVLGIRQPIEEIGLLLKAYPEIVFHSDITQLVGKSSFDLENVDLASFSGHKIHCLKGIGGLICKNSTVLSSQIVGGQSLTPYRSGTPQNELIFALAKSLEQIESNDEFIFKINQFIKDSLQAQENVVFNGSEKSVPHILNLSILGQKATDIQAYLSQAKIMVSTSSACSSNTDVSSSVLLITQDLERAKSSIRLSFSRYNTIEEAKQFVLAIETYLGGIQ